MLVVSGSKLLKEIQTLEPEAFVLVLLRILKRFPPWLELYVFLEVFFQQVLFITVALVVEESSGFIIIDPVDELLAVTLAFKNYRLQVAR